MNVSIPQILKAKVQRCNIAGGRKNKTTDKIKLHFKLQHSIKSNWESSTEDILFYYFRGCIQAF